MPNPRSADWRAQAACRRLPTDAMYPHPRDTIGTHQAKKVCASCPVAQKCLTEALEHRDPHGIWGGLTDWERDRLLAGAKPVWCACGVWYVPRLAAQKRCRRCSLLTDPSRTHLVPRPNAERAATPERTAA